MASYTKTQTSILDIAQELSQIRGFNAFSYRDIADRIGIRSASIHHHFRTKSDLGVAMTERYRATFMQAVRQLEASEPDAFARLRRYADLFLGTLESGRMCLCGALAIEYDTLDPSMQGEVVAFFQENERWLERVFEDAKAGGQLPVSAKPDRLAASFLAVLEGAMMTARAGGQTRRFVVAVDEFIDRLQD